ncbi:MAG: SDR family NAD(P)-dependent oxidoreductase [Kiritimatiellae bacterium]|nr:SDR family NAD(P)-dependent oxidoreductase [Kiritimatiellia bacterium]
MKILVTGAAGFIGAALSEELLARGHEVVGLDDFNGYYAPALKEARAARLAGKPGFRMVRGDLADAAAVDAAFAAAGGSFGVVVNLAAQAGVRYSLENPSAYVRSNLVGFANILEACRHRGVPRLVYASSSSVYGGNKKMPFSEDDRVDAPVSLYAATKKSDELMAHVYSHLFGLQTVGLRFFTVYGPWGRPDMALWLFTEAMLAGKPIKVFNHGKMKRDFTYISDIVSGVVSCVESDKLGREEIFNIGNNKPEELLRMIEVLAGALGVEPKTEMLPMQPGDVPATYADVSRIGAKLGYAPTTPIEVGIPKFAAWYKEYHGL